MGNCSGDVGDVFWRDFGGVEGTFGAELAAVGVEEETGGGWVVAAVIWECDGGCPVGYWLGGVVEGLGGGGL